MSLPIKVVKCPTNKYGIKCPYSMTPTRIVVHNTANDATAMNEVSYMINNNNQTSFHYAVDEKQAVQGIPLNRNSWHAGDGAYGKGNRQGIGIEICYSRSGGDRFLKAERNGAKLVAMLLKQYGWGMDKVTKHQDYSGKYCPHRTLDMGWQRFLKMVQEELNGAPTPTQEIYRVRKSWGDVNSQLGAFAVYENAKKCADENRGFYVFNNKGLKVYPINTNTNSTKTIDQLAREVIDGKWGNGVDRVNRLTNAGYNVNAVQDRVNTILANEKNEKIAREVIQGKWGNGSERKRRLERAGYDYEEIQRLVNKMM